MRRPGIGKGRELLDTGDDIASTLINSTLWLEADVLSLTGYAMRTLPTSIADARTSVNGETVNPACSNILSGHGLVLCKAFHECTWLRHAWWWRACMTGTACMTAKPSVTLCAGFMLLMPFQRPGHSHM